MESNNSRFLGEYSWDTVCLKEISLKIGSGSTPRGGESAYIPERKKFAFIRSQNVYDFKFDVSGLRFISDEDANKLKGVHLQKDDVLINITGDGVTFSRCCLVPEEILPAAVNQHVAIIRLDKSKCLPGYLMAYLCLPETKAYIESFNAGGSRRAITKGHIESFEIPLPPMLIQEHISRVTLGLLAKQSINTQINQTLEQMAQALFKSWFVDFDPVVDNALDAGFFEQDLEFSDELLRRAEARKAARENADFKPLSEDIRQLFPAAFEECSEPSLGLGGWVPEGWVYDCFSELLSSTIGGDWGKDSQDEKHTTQSRIVRGTDIPDLISGQLSNAPLRWVDPKKLQSRQIEAGDIIIEVSGGSPTQSTGRSIFMTQSILNRLGGVVEPASFCRRFKPKSFCLGVLASLHLQAIYSDGKMWEYQNQSTGIANFQTKFFLEAERVLMPSDKVLENFCQIVTPLIEKSQNSEQVALAKLRDTLLPKLISGELCIGDGEFDTADEVLA